MSIWCKSHSQGPPELPRCPECEIQGLKARVAELDEAWQSSQDCGQRLTYEHDRYREALEQIALVSDSHGYDAREIAQEALNPHPSRDQQEANLLDNGLALGMDL